MKYAIIKLNANNHEIVENSVRFKTIYGDVPVREKKVIVEGNVARVPLWNFAQREINPCMMISGYVGITEQ